MRPINHLEASNGRICIGNRDQVLKKEPSNPIYLSTSNINIEDPSCPQEPKFIL